ncbi:MAG: lipoprotein [Gemmatimonadaceae bacterium]|nr:lipoprotein [Gemmatimonadaceae bacterium]
MRAVRQVIRRTWPIGLCALLAGCRGEHPATASDAVLQFYTMRDALGGTGAPTAKELAALRPFIADSLARGLFIADSLRQADMERAPDEKPRFVEGDMFSSLFEGATAYRVMPAIPNTDPALVPVEFTNDKERPVVRWTDTVVVTQHDGRWLVHDVRYGGTWDFGNKGTLLRQLAPSP